MSRNYSLAEQCSNERKFPRLNVRCPARIRIAKRQYAGFIDDLSAGGAHIVTVTPIKESGPVLLQLPDLPPMWAEIRWAKPTDGGVRFHRRLDSEVLKRWIGSRNGGAEIIRPVLKRSVLKDKIVRHTGSPKCVSCSAFGE